MQKMRRNEMKSWRHQISAQYQRGNGHGEMAMAASWRLGSESCGAIGEEHLRGVAVIEEISQIKYRRQSAAKVTNVRK
jgi:hypothetical protein